MSRNNQKLDKIAIAATTDRVLCLRSMTRVYDRVLIAYFSAILRQGYTEMLKADLMELGYLQTIL